MPRLRRTAKSNHVAQCSHCTSYDKHRSLPPDSTSQRYSRRSESSKIQTPGIMSRSVKASGFGRCVSPSALQGLERDPVWDRTRRVAFFSDLLKTASCERGSLLVRLLG